MVNHSVAKAMLFLLAGNILGAYGTKSVDEVQGVLRRLPASGCLWVAGLLAILGTPPFALFLSEFLIVRAAIEGGRPALAAGFLALLAWIFAAMSRSMLRIAQGAPSAAGAGARAEPFLAVAPPAALAVATLVLGLLVPGPLLSLLRQAAAALGGS
jgi:hydrogenase-4 component F